MTDPLVWFGYLVTFSPAILGTLVLVLGASIIVLFTTVCFYLIKLTFREIMRKW